MVRSIRQLSMVLVAGTLLGAAPQALAAEISEISKDEFYAASYYKQALEDDRIKKLRKEAAKLKKIARSIHLSPKKLQAAIEKVDSLGGDPAQLAAQAIRGGAGETRVNGRLLDVLINANEPKHVVAYVRFRAKNRAEVIKDASAIAHLVAEKAPLVSTLSLSAIHPAAGADSKTPVWSAKIGAGRAESINPKRIEDYADRMYKRLFEIVDDKPF